MHTTFGDVELEFWPREAPKAVRNFVQLCLERYYDNTIFHRVIKGFMVQGGDPEGTGRGATAARAAGAKCDPAAPLTLQAASRSTANRSRTSTTRA